MSSSLVENAPDEEELPCGELAAEEEFNSDLQAVSQPGSELSEPVVSETLVALVEKNHLKPAARPMSQAAREREELLRYFYPENLRWKNVDWVVATWMIAMHAGALAAPFFFTWEALAVTVVLHWLTCSIGICMTFHRCLSHRSLKLRGPAKFLGTLCGSIAGEGSPLTWAATHRVHHGYSDQPGDPHSPLEGPWWAHLWWMMVKTSPRKRQLLYQYYAPDMVRDPMMQFFEKTFAIWLWGTAIALFCIGGLPMLLWGMCVRMVLAYHSTWFVNSATHLWGYRNYETTDASRNLWWVALFAYGEGWHNNHHAHPRLARAGHRWWEFDMTWWTISFLRLIGQATDVDDRIPEGNAAT